MKILYIMKFKQKKKINKTKMNYNINKKLTMQ